MACGNGEHDYQMVPKLETRINSGKDTHVQGSFFCRKCCDVQTRVIAVWKDWPKPKEVK